MRYLFPPISNTVRSPTNDADANVALSRLGLLQFAASIASAQRYIASADRGSRSMKSRIRFSETILNLHVPIAGTMRQAESETSVRRPQKAGTPSASKAPGTASTATVRVRIVADSHAGRAAQPRRNIAQAAHQGPCGAPPPDREARPPECLRVEVLKLSNSRL